MYSHDFAGWLLFRSDRRQCRRLLRHGSHSFFAASLLLPREYREPITALYAFCRVADDQIDATAATEDALQDLRLRLDGIYAGRPAAQAVDRAFAEVVHHHNIPRALPAALLEGFAWDVANRRYESLSELYAYAARVAGTVGAMMAVLMGVRRPEVLSRACDLGIAMQLTNIARDVGEDARAGRLYLPVDMLKSQGTDPSQWIDNPVFRPEIGAIVTELLAVAERLYRRADWGISQLPLSCRPAMFAARTIYAEIGQEIAKRSFDSVSSRAVVGTTRKLGLLGAALRSAVSVKNKDPAPPLQEVRFLLNALAV